MTDSVDVHLRASPPVARRDDHLIGELQSQSRRGERHPRSDLGTICLHWTMVVSILVALATGLRLAADDETAWFARALSPILPQGEIWTPHFLAAFAVVACALAYAVYLRLGHLKRRVSPR